MTYSALTDLERPPTGKYMGRNKWSSRGGQKVDGMNVHHWASTGMGGYSRLVESGEPASANYLILNDGRLIGSVPEEYRAWTTSSFANDDDKITVEIQNQTGAPSWSISPAAMRTLIELYADVARRYGFSPVRANLKGHREYGVATACPGPYLSPRLDFVAEEAAKLGMEHRNKEDEFMSALSASAQKKLADRVHETNAGVNRLEKILAQSVNSESLVSRVKDIESDVATMKKDLKAVLAAVQKGE